MNSREQRRQNDENKVDTNSYNVDNDKAKKDQRLQNCIMASETLTMTKTSTMTIISIH